jgi:glycerol-3-phosphate dehydrogenase
MAFNSVGRRAALSALGKTRLDLLIVGGGITGCGIARDAALRGWKVGLVEKEDFAFGTSSRSSKIIHGGVRYLEYGHFLLVRESARERAVLLEIAPHLVHPIPFIFPVFRGESVLKVRAGLTVFDFLAEAEGDDKHVNVSPEEIRAQLPGLRDTLKGGVRYPEYLTDDARLTLENAQSAAEHGALVVNHARAEALRTEHGRVVGCRVVDTLEDRGVDVSARIVINATGAWSENLLSEANIEPEYSLVPSKGIHLLFSAERLPITGATFLRASSGKRGLAMRRLGFVYVGTTDDEYTGSLDRPRATRADVDEVLEMTQDCFPEQNLGHKDILATWAGVRPLIREEGKSTRDTSREDAVWHAPPGLITVAGGKLTTYREMARRVLEVADPDLGPATGNPDRTASVPLPGAVVGPMDIHEYRERRGQDFVDMGVPLPTVERLTWLYGRQLDYLIALGAEDASWLELLHPDIPALRGEVYHAVEQEMALTLTDFMDRRAALLIFSENFGLAAAEAAADIMGDLLGWDGERRNREVADYRLLASEHALPAS